MCVKGNWASERLAESGPHPESTTRKVNHMSEFISPEDSLYDERSREMVRVGREAIACENDVRLTTFFSDDFVFHGPDGDLSGWSSSR